MIISDADRIYLGEQAVDRLYLGEELIWPAEQPVPEVHILGITTIDGTLCDDTYSIWEHNTMQPIWIKHDGELVNPSIQVIGGYFIVDHIEGDMFILKDSDWYNNNTPREATLKIMADNVEEAFYMTVTKGLESQGMKFVYTNRASVATVRTISANGEDNVTEAYSHLVYAYPNQNAATLPYRNDGLNGYGKYIQATSNGYVVNEGLSTYGCVEVSDTINGIKYNDDNALEIYNVRTTFTNCEISYHIGENITGHNRYFGIFVYPSNVTQSPIYWFLIQPSK